jgi:hypothetical protein
MTIVLISALIEKCAESTAVLPPPSFSLFQGLSSVVLEHFQQEPLNHAVVLGLPNPILVTIKN